MRVPRPSSLPLIALLLSASYAPLTAQSEITWDSSGNHLLQGSYNFREVLLLVGDDAGNLSRSVSMNGTLNFDGAGAYTLKASVLDSTESGPQSYETTGTYTIAASGYGFISSPVQTDGRIFGLVAQGVFVGSSSEDVINDLFIAAPAGSTPPTSESFNGKYWVAEMNFPTLNIAQARDALFQLNPDGQGNLGAITASGYIGNGRITTQTVNGSSYSFNAGIGAVTFGSSTNSSLLSGSRTLYLSPDGNFVFGGSADGWNMFVGVRALSDDAVPELMNGQYYQAGVDVTTSTLPDGYATLNTYTGAFRAKDGIFWSQQRLLPGFDTSPYDYMFSDFYTLEPDGSFDDFLGFHNILGAGGAIRISFGQRGGPGINIALKAPNFTGPGVFVDPSSIVNAASNAPFTSGIARGELLTLSGTNLSNSGAEDGVFPTTLAGVQVLVNNRPAPIKSVSPTRISFLVPYATTEPIARIQVINDGVESNPVTAFLNVTAPGAFTNPPGGTGFAVVLHADTSPVTKENPAQPGETVTVRVTGLGDVDPSVPDATSGPSDPLSVVTASTAAFLDGERADVKFAGLTPGQTGLYDMNITIPDDASSGELYLDISGPDAYSSQAQVPVGGKSLTTLQQRESVTSTKSRTRRVKDHGRPAGTMRKTRGAARLDKLEAPVQR